MRQSTEDMIQFIIVNGYYPSFVKFCSTIPSVKSKRRKAYLFMRKYSLYKCFNIIGAKNLFDIAKVKWL